MKFHPGRFCHFLKFQIRFCFYGESHSHCSPYYLLVLFFLKGPYSLLVFYVEDVCFWSTAEDHLFSICQYFGNHHLLSNFFLISWEYFLAFFKNLKLWPLLIWAHLFCRGEIRLKKVLLENWKSIVDHYLSFCKFLWYLVRFSSYFLSNSW